MKKRVLISNDDGFYAPGIRALAESLSSLYDVYVVAPSGNRSGASMSLTLHTPLRCEQMSEKSYSVAGTPADCVIMALNHLLDFKPDMMVSGINRGGNLGRDTLYSGTVAAAIEATLRGIPSLAVSVDGEDPLKYDVVAEYTRDLLQSGLLDLNENGQLINLNMPNLDRKEIKGLKFCPLGNKSYEDNMICNVDPRGSEYFWIGGNIDQSVEPIPETDSDFVHKGYGALTVLKPSYEQWDATLRLKEKAKDLSLSGREFQF